MTFELAFCFDIDDVVVVHDGDDEDDDCYRDGYFNWYALVSYRFI